MTIFEQIDHLLNQISGTNKLIDLYHKSIIQESNSAKLELKIETKNKLIKIKSLLESELDQLTKQVTKQIINGVH